MAETTGTMSMNTLFTSLVDPAALKKNRFARHRPRFLGIAVVDGAIGARLPDHAEYS